MPLADQRIESHGAGPSSSPPTITAAIAEIPQKRESEEQRPAQVSTTSSRDNMNVEQVSTPLPSIPAFIPVISTAPVEQAADTVMDLVVDRFRENTITKDLIQAPPF